MSADQKKPETSPAAEKLAHYWTQFKQGKLISYRVMAVILLVVAGTGLWLYIRSEKKVGTSKVWFELENASTESGLDEFIKNNPNTMAAKVAQLHLARYQLGPDGIAKLTDAKDPIARKQAVESIHKAQETFTKLAEESANDPVVRAECYLGLAKAEAALIGATREGSDEFHGSFDKAIEWLDKLAEAADGTPWGEEARKLAASLKTEKDKPNLVRDELTSVQAKIYSLGDTSGLPGGGPLFPGAPPFGSPLGGTPGVPAIPGGPIAPPTPEVTPGTPGTGPPLPPPTGNPPIPPAVAPATPGKEPSTPTPPVPPKK